MGKPRHHGVHSKTVITYLTPFIVTKNITCSGEMECQVMGMFRTLVMFVTTPLHGGTSRAQMRLFIQYSLIDWTLLLQLYILLMQTSSLVFRIYTKVKA